ncbi:MAG: LysE family transporter [Bacteroidales bacterium]|nr:LysE family transporter [Bacteroidales bacterium]
MLLQITVDKGWKSAVYFCLGVWVSDFIYLNLAYFGLGLVGEGMQSDAYQSAIAYVGAIILIIFGLVSFFSKEKTKPIGEESLQTKNIVLLSLKGFAVNTLNPFLFIFWLGVIASVGLDPNNREAFWFFVLGFIGTIILTDLIKVYLAKIIRDKLRPIHLVYFRKIAGIILIGFGLALLWR